MATETLKSSISCDTLVIGGGPGGYVCAIRLAQLGKSVVLVEERDSLGGVCLNEGCIPSKALIHAAETLEGLSFAPKMGIKIAGETSLDVPALQKWKTSIVTRLTKGIAMLQKKAGVQVIQGRAAFQGPGSAEIAKSDGEKVTVTYSDVVIATGSLPMELPGIPVDGEFVIGSKEALSLPEVPKHLIVIGGGYIGLELGTVYRKLGAQVTVIEVLDQLLGGQLEPEIHQILLRRARRLKIKVLLSHRAQKAISDDTQALEVIDDKGNTKNIEADRILIAIGRRPCTDGLNLEAIGLATDDKGFISVDNQMRTSVPNVYAIGDVVGQPMLAHKASMEAKIAAEVIAGHDVAFEPKGIPGVMFTDPEIATVGMTEAQAKEAGYEVKTGAFPWKASGRAMSLNVTDGITKIITDAKTEKVLGVHIAGPHASELIGEGVLALEVQALIKQIAYSIHPHPTLSETVMEAAEDVLDACTHV